MNVIWSLVIFIFIKKLVQCAETDKYHQKEKTSYITSQKQLVF